MFDEFILPALTEESNYLDHSIYHYDGIGALRHLDSVLSIESLDGIQWVPGAGNPPQAQWTELLVRIQEAGKSLHISASPEEIKHLHGILKPELVFYDTWANNEKEADALIQWFVNHT
jgi:5-methyltetrahydrofolate--homocysteine methyltransferase